ncbi:mucin-21-like [Halyomorpha halys]|uniref:mucin-21-like n=1 Tax=Halyomorpha halys TaxID=286706 RepID=UPI0034D38391
MKSVTVTLLIVLAGSSHAFTIGGFFGSVAKHTEENLHQKQNQVKNNINLMNEHMKDFEEAYLIGDFLGGVKLFAKKLMNLGKHKVHHKVHNTEKVANDAVEDIQYLIPFRPKKTPSKEPTTGPPEYFPVSKENIIPETGTVNENTSSLPEPNADKSVTVLAGKNITEPEAPENSTVTKNITAKLEISSAIENTTGKHEITNGIKNIVAEALVALANHKQQTTATTENVVTDQETTTATENTAAKMETVLAENGASEPKSPTIIENVATGQKSPVNIENTTAGSKMPAAIENIADKQETSFTIEDTAKEQQSASANGNKTTDEEINATTESIPENKEATSVLENILAKPTDQVSIITLDVEPAIPAITESSTTELKNPVVTENSNYQTETVISNKNTSKVYEEGEKTKPNMPTTDKTPTDSEINATNESITENKQTTSVVENIVAKPADQVSIITLDVEPAIPAITESSTTEGGEKTAPNMPSTHTTPKETTTDRNIVIVVSIKDKSSTHENTSSDPKVNSNNTSTKTEINIGKDTTTNEKDSSISNENTVTESNTSATTETPEEGSQSPTEINIGKDTTTNEKDSSTTSNENTVTESDTTISDKIQQEVETTEIISTNEKTTLENKTNTELISDDKISVGPTDKTTKEDVLVITDKPACEGKTVVSTEKSQIDIIEAIAALKPGDRESIITHKETMEKKETHDFYTNTISASSPEV